MSNRPQPLFETIERFRELNFLHLNAELPVVREYLESFDHNVDALEGYRAVRGFLKSYSGVEATFNSYRTHVERLLLWSLLIVQNLYWRCVDETPKPLWSSVFTPQSIG